MAGSEYKIKPIQSGSPGFSLPGFSHPSPLTPHSPQHAPLRHPLTDSTGHRGPVDRRPSAEVAGSFLGPQHLRE